MSRVRFGDILYIKGRIGWQLLKKEEYLKSGDYYLITGIDITDTHRIKFDQCYFVSKERYETDDKIQLKVGDIIVTKDGTIGKIGIIDKLDKPATLNSHLFLIRNEAPNILDTGYLFQILRSQTFQKYASNNTSGSNIPAFTQANISNFEIDLPSFAEQQNISRILNDIDNKIICNVSINNELESLAKTLYDYWFLQFEFPNEEGKPYKSSGGKMIWNEELKREIPEGWTYETLKNKYSVKRGISYTSKDIESGKGIPMINLACIDTERNYRDGELKYFNGQISKECKLESGDMLIATTDLTRNADIVGCPIVVPYDNLNYTYTMDLAKFEVTDKKLNRWYVYSSLRTNGYHNFIKRWASGTNVLHLNLDGINWYKMFIPEKNVQEKFAVIMENICKKQSKILEENRELSSLRDWLLPMLMNGQVTFKEDNAEA